MVRTSISDPLRIDEVAVPGTRGLLGLTICPGKQQVGGVSGHWRRDLDLDLQTIADWGASLILNLIEDHEMHALGVADTPPSRRPAGARIIVHCKGGLGRTGLVVTRLLIEFGTPPEEAIAIVRAARPGAIETAEQYRYVLALETHGLTS